MVLNASIFVLCFFRTVMFLKFQFFFFFCESALFRFRSIKFFNCIGLFTVVMGVIPGFCKSFSFSINFKQFYVCLIV